MSAGFTGSGIGHRGEGKLADALRDDDAQLVVDACVGERRADAVERRDDRGGADCRTAAAPGTGLPPRCGRSRRWSRQKRDRGEESVVAHEHRALDRGLAGEGDAVLVVDGCRRLTLEPIERTNASREQKDPVHLAVDRRLAHSARAHRSQQRVAPGAARPGMARSWEAFAASTLRTAVQSLITTPSKPHSEFSGVSRSSLSQSS